jgi:long-chain fatty acid transport protein
MGYFRSHPKISVITFIVSQTFFTLPAFAAGFQINEISPGLQGDATAGAAAANNDVSSLFINPATLSTLILNQAYIGASEILPTIKMSDASAIHTVNVPGQPPSSISAPVQGASSQSNVGQGALVPNAYLGIRINPNLVAGLAVIAPYGLKTHYENDSVLRFAADYSAVQTVDVVPAIAYSINNQWALGLGFQAQYINATFSNYNGPYTGVAPIDALIASTQPTLLKAHGWGYGYTAGVFYKPDLCTRIGLGFRSQISEQLRGDGQQYVSPGDTVPAPSQEFLFNAQTSVHGAIKTPAVLTLSAARDFGRWTLKGSAQVNFWSTFNKLSIYMPDAFATNATFQTKWRNTFFGALGAEFNATPAWTFRGGVAYDQTPTVNSYRDPRIPDNDRIWANIGATYHVTKCLSFDAAYSHIFIMDQTVNVTQASGTNTVATVPLEENQVYAKYKGSADVIGIAARISF